MARRAGRGRLCGRARAPGRAGGYLSRPSPRPPGAPPSAGAVDQCHTVGPNEALMVSGERPRGRWIRNAQRREGVWGGGCAWEGGRGARRGRALRVGRRGEGGVVGWAVPGVGPWRLTVSGDPFQEGPPTLRAPRPGAPARRSPTSGLCVFARLDSLLSFLRLLLWAGSPLWPEDPSRSLGVPGTRSG